MQSRKMNFVKNLFSGFITRIVMMIMSFVVRTVFVYTLGAEYLGMNGLFTNILTVLSLAELGFGSAMIYSLYKPLADNNHEEVLSIMNLYRKACNIIGLIVIGAGLCVIPFLDDIVSNRPNIPFFELIYILYLFNTGLSYLSGAYKKSLLTADQKQYLVNLYANLFTFIKSILQIIILIVFKNFILYLIIQVLCTILENLYCSKQIDKKYPYMRNIKLSKINTKEKKKIFKDVKALFLTRIGHIMLNGTDNLIISKFIGLAEVGILSNYILIIDSLTSLVNQICTAATASIGNFIASNDNEANHTLFKNIEFLNYWIYSCCTLCLIFLLNPFIKIWIGKDYLFDSSIVIVLGINFFIAGICNVFWTFRSTLGLFVQGQYRSIIVGVVNVVLSIVFAKYMGVFGVLIATTVSRVCITLWYDPYIIYKYGFSKSVKIYLKVYFNRFLAMGVCIFICIWFSQLIQIESLISLIIFAIVIFIVINIVNCIFFFYTSEFKYYLSIGKNIICKKMT